MATTIKTIASHFGCSVSTVSRALNNSGYVKEELREAISAYARENDWYASSAAVSMVKGKTKTVAFVVNKLSNYINSVLLEQIVVNLRDKGFHVFISQSTYADEQTNELESYIYRRPDAVIVFPLVRSDNVSGIVKKLVANGTQVIAMGARESDLCSSVVYDFYRQGYMMAEHLLNYGHRDIAFFGEFNGEAPAELVTAEPPSGLLSVMRLQGCIAAMQERGASFDPSRDVVDNHITPSTLEQTLQAGRHTAFICTNLSMLTLFYKMCGKLQLKIGQDISVIGLGFNPLLDGFMPQPTCLDPGTEQMGEAIAALITDKTNIQDVTTISPVSISGNSVKNIG